MSKFSGNEARRKQKALTPLREASGKLQREPQEERTAEIVAIVLAQPHRRGDGDDRRSTPIGRLILDKRIAQAGGMSIDEQFRAAELYIQAFGNIRRVWDSRRPLAHNPDGRTPSDIPVDMVRRYESEWGDIGRVLRDAGVMVTKAIEHLLQDALPDDDERVYAFWVRYGAGVGLLALARHFGITR
jgi:hypothetical protein